MQILAQDQRAKQRNFPFSELMNYQCYGYYLAYKTVCPVLTSFFKSSTEIKYLIGIAQILLCIVSLQGFTLD